MYIKNNKTYAEPYKYLIKEGTRRIIALHLGEAREDFEERDMTLPINARIDGPLVKWENGLFAALPESMTYEAIKAKIIKSRYSNDDQIAILLNKSKGPEEELEYQRMQRWRDMASDVAKSAMSVTFAEFEVIQ